jgi:hypothetical protein
MTTYTEAQRQKIAAQRQEVKRLLRIDEQQYCDMLFEAGGQYLAHVMRDDHYGQRVMSYDRRFWEWYRVAYSRADRDWLAVHAARLAARSLQAHYRLAHHPARMRVHVPNKVVYGIWTDENKRAFKTQIK